MVDVEIRDKRWALKPKGEQALVQSLAKELNISSTLANLLVQRGISSFDEAKTFFRPKLSDLHDPFLMKDMDKAIDRIENALKQNEKIMVYGDYDVDGTTAVALVYSFFKTFYNDLDYYLPDRYKEGYGISFAGIDHAKANGFTLIIALDCGIKANDKVIYAKERGIDFVICDHHRPGEFLPEASAVLDPKRDDDTYPFKELSGCGIGFKLIQAYAQRHKVPFEQIEVFLDLVAVSTAADIVPIVGENRVLVYHGLQWLNKNPRPGIKAILELAQVKRELTVNDIVFIIGPRINAAGRIQDARQAVDLLISANAAQALFEGKNIDEKNSERRSLDLNITEQALQIIQEDSLFAKRKSTVLFHPEWHKGVIGIVASRLTEKYYRPTIILTESNGLATGSARSVKDFDIYNAIESCSDLLEQFGGHMYAAGLTLKLENLEKFSERFEEIVAATIDEKSLIQEIEIDSVLKLTEISTSFFSVLKQFAPFGPGNMSPVFKTENVRDTGLSRIVGNNHLKLNLAEDETTRFGLDGIAFQMGQYYPFISRRIPFDICYTLEENTFNGKTNIQMNVKDIRMK
ncbi:MAG: single-stranded-DNA-specific exonuclease RecJ [Bacteroidetes bacterium]|jgi:single-stranded-DNA-specific exonuclease|nr:single-stranded-DNA-specific exonuclease RecJ [Bacteroidota bacterium]MBP6401196.1 single-stranded-DNA-specific exonuclease RecJ [Bacteroidia bacterium]MBK9523736.1 single-stranded-DNA-specific exonuclease RecJ [Bacteroidota bacterium]MBK9541487.1 single-stranded-DNA-specific exonuclease RecJ [Bacteroidota bacterium]MBL0258641.1 single-stranded-DNA-specific exonuclease RecJ [Bacteroidota bacterium]